jgi:hypothetical protein
MGTVRVIVLRLFVDAAQPGRLAGSLRCVPDGHALTFAGAGALLAALRGQPDFLQGVTACTPDSFATPLFCSSPPCWSSPAGR